MFNYKENQMFHVDDLKFIGAGKIIYHKSSDSFNIPHLHFLTIEYERGVFQAVNLEFQLFSLGETQEKTIANLTEMVSFYIINACQKGKGFEELKAVTLLKNMEEYWAKYREIEFELAKIKKNVKQNISNTIKNMVNKSIAKLVSNILYQEVR